MAIRPMRPEDWPRIWPYFNDIVQDGETYAYPLDLTPETGYQLWNMPAPGQTVVYEADGELPGTATMGPNRDGRGSHIGTGSFMVDPRAQGRGIGRALGEYVVGWHAAAGFRGIQFNAVVETNASAVHLWQALGFRIIGTVPEAFDSRRHGLVGLHVMYRPIDASD